MPIRRLVLAFSAGAALLLGAAAETPVAVAAEPADCDGCYLGIYDDAAMTRTSGAIAPLQTKSIYLGIELGAGVPSIGALQFQADYPSGFTVLDVTSYVAGADYEPGGANSVSIQWPGCIAGKRLLYRIRVLTFRSVRDVAVQIRNAIGVGCTDKSRSWRIPSGCYVVNPGSRTPPCALAVAPSTWSGVKGLFRSPLYGASGNP